MSQLNAVLQYLHRKFKFPNSFASLSGKSWVQKQGSEVQWEWGSDYTHAWEKSHLKNIFIFGAKMLLQVSFDKT